eukprot:m.39003 g.39003  ORF g.39003 m.39003 type:complete len:420 (-) comp11227_c0_seq3:167-1426(-)
MAAIVKSLGHPAEVFALVDFMLLGGQRRIFPKPDLSEETPSMKRCYEFLDKTSRSFAAVIKALHTEMRPAICIFYLVLRGLDTVEDDMTIDSDVKSKLLRSFHERIEERGFTFDGNAPTEKDRQLLVEFDVVVQEYLNLDVKYREVIKDITKRMGNGMADFQHKPVETLEDYNLYCHYVAGLVGVGLSQLFAASGLESAQVGQDLELANSMGLFLQKTNIIRDYREDLEEGRTWWPREVWGKYSGKLSDFALMTHRQRGLHCLNDLVTDALQHVPDVFEYMSRLKCQSIFNFCAIPQVMAISTLELCYNNEGVLTSVVKIRKGLAVSLMLEATTLGDVYLIFERFAASLRAKVCRDDPSAAKTRAVLDKIEGLLTAAREAGKCPPKPRSLPSTGLLVTGGLVAGAAAWMALSQQQAAAF